MIIFVNMRIQPDKNFAKLIFQTHKKGGEKRENNNNNLQHWTYEPLHSVNLFMRL